MAKDKCSMRTGTTLYPAQWIPLLVEIPGHELIPAGVLLIDHSRDRLYVRTRTDLSGADEDLLEILRYLREDLEATAEELGANSLVNRFETDWSLSLRLGRRHAVRVASPSEAVGAIFEREILAGAYTQVHVPRFSSQQLVAARASISFSPGTAIRILTAFRDALASFSGLESLISQDPLISAHLVHLSNLAIHSRWDSLSRWETRSVSEALRRLGTDQAAWHVAALTLRKAFSSPRLRTIWNHSVEVVQIARRICKQLADIKTEEITLTALVHDIGQLCCVALGEPFFKSFAELERFGDYQIEIERKLFGSSHADIGADLLATWSFPSDMVEAIKVHHAPDLSETVMSDVICLAEALSDQDEDFVDIRTVSHLIERLRIDLDLTRKTEPLEADLASLRFSAAA
jgi:putative nucleotidyltransferase with HDIG domain